MAWALIKLRPRISWCKSLLEGNCFPSSHPRHSLLFCFLTAFPFSKPTPVYTVQFTTNKPLEAFKQQASERATSSPGRWRQPSESLLNNEINNLGTSGSQSQKGNESFLFFSVPLFTWSSQNRLPIDKVQYFRFAKRTHGAR